MRTQTPMGSSRSPRAAILLASLGLVRFLPLAALIDPPVEDHLDVRPTRELPLQILVEVLRGPGNDEQVALFSHRFAPRGFVDASTRCRSTMGGNRDLLILRVKAVGANTPRQGMRKLCRYSSIARFRLAHRLPRGLNVPIPSELIRD